MQLAWTRKLENLTKVHMANLRVLIQLLCVRDFWWMGEVEGGSAAHAGEQTSTPRYFIDCRPATSRNELHFPEFAAGGQQILMALLVSSSPPLMCFDSHSGSKAASGDNGFPL